MIIYVFEGKRINFADRKVRDRVRKYFGTMEQRDDYSEFVQRLWDTVEADELNIPIPEIEGVT